MDYGSATCFLTGLLIGSVLDTTTTIVLLLVGITIVNKPLPDIMGAITPQDIVRAALIKGGRAIKNFTMNEGSPIRSVMESSKKDGTQDLEDKIMLPANTFLLRTKIPTPSIK